MRRFVIAEEKMLLMTKESDEKVATAQAIIDIVDSCMESDVDVEALRPFDLDWLFLQLRAQSVENTVQLRYNDLSAGPDKDPQEFNLNLDDVSIPAVGDLKRTIEVDENVSVVVTFPTITQMLNITRELEKEGTRATLNDYVVAASIISIYDKEGEEYQADTEEEIFEWINSLPSKPYTEITEFLDSIPELTHTIEFTNHAGEPDEVVLSGIYDFFTF